MSASTDSNIYNIDQKSMPTEPVWRLRVEQYRDMVRFGIPVYWVVNLLEQQIEVYTQPQNSSREPTYKHRQDYVAPMRVGVIIEGEKVGSLNILDLSL